MTTAPLSTSLLAPFRPNTTAMAKLNYWVAIELSVPGKMQLLPIFGPRETIVDFRCAVASPAVARLLNESSGEAVGRCLSTLLASHDDGEEILLAYIEAAKTGKPCCCESLSQRDEVIQHRLSINSRFVVDAELRNVTAVARARAAYQQLKSVPQMRA